MIDFQLFTPKYLLNNILQLFSKLQAKNHFFFNKKDLIFAMQKNG